PLAAERAAPAAAAAGAATARLAAAERRVAAALASLVREPSAALAALLANQTAADNSGSRHPGYAGHSRGDSFAAARAYAEEAAAASAAGARLSSAKLSSRADMPSTAVLLERLRVSIDARLDELRSSEHDTQRRKELSRRRARLQAQEQFQRQAAETAARQVFTIADEWRDWLINRSLPPELSPEAAMETFDLAEQAMLRLQTLDRITAKAAALDLELAAFETAADHLADAFPAIAKTAAGDSAIALRLLHNEAIRHAEINKQLGDLHNKYTEYDLKRAELETQFGRLMLQQEQWFLASEAAGELQLLEILAKSERFHQIESELYKRNAELTAGLTEEQLQIIEDWFAESDAQQLEAMRAGADEEWTNQEKRKSELLEKSGRLQQQLELLLRDRDRQQLTAEREKTAAALEQLIERYAVLAMSMSLIGRTKRVMEEERQPAVIREASRFMALLSEGKYRRIAVPEGEQTILLEMADGRLVDSPFLSRGTAEQLYLAMRFALADEASAAVELPMILDDLFVNFDKQRLEAAVQVIAELSGRRQIIMLTCHDHVRDLMMDKLPNAQLVRLA
ncbi:ATP-binding protein, partial [Paenibacillus solisilvae]